MKNRLLPTFLFLAYTILLLKIMVFKDLPMIRIGQLHLNFGGTQEGEANYIPFKTIWFYLIGSRGMLIGGINILGNILLLVPLGYLMPFATPGLLWKQVLVYALLICMAIEGSQVLLKVGILDVDDMILNFLGFLLGYAAGRRIQRWTPSKISKQIGLAISLVLVVWLGFYLPKDQFPIGFEDEMPHMNRKPTGKNAEALVDLCGGTGGTGIIQSKGNDYIVIVRKDGVVQKIRYTAKTHIQSSAGLLQAAGLKKGDRVTIVTIEDKIMTASDILVCQEPSGDVTRKKFR